MKRDSRNSLALALATALAIAGCASTGEAPVEDHSVDVSPRPRPATTASSRRAAPATGSYRVERGDTLYSIAFRHGIDYRELAAWNGIEPPYTIYPGRELRLSPREAPGRAIAAAPAAGSALRSPPGSAAPPTPRSTAPGPFQPVASVPAGTAPASASAPASGASAPPSPPAAPAPAPPATPTSRAPIAAAPPASDASAAGGIAWRWPADGEVVGTYLASDPTRQGVDIAGAAGAPVRAAADGTVVYSGNGLIGYGELIIVKHSPSVLSAYGHNRKRLVQEGDRVRAGQTIAEMGSSGASRDELHFEIRRNGKPSNPLDYLPHR